MVGVLFALLLAAMMAVGSGANFNSTSANPGNMVTAGNLSHTNSKTGALLTVTKLKPGESQTGTVTLANDGDIDGVFSVARTIVNDSGNTLTPAAPFAARLNLKIEDNATGTVYYDNLLSSMTGTVGAGTLAPAASRTYKFTVTFLNTSGANGQDNKWKGASVEANFNWEAVNN